MAWTAPATFSTSQVVTASDLNTQLRDNMNMLWREVAYVEFTADVTVATSDTEVSPLDVVSAGAVTYAAVPTIVEFFAPGIQVGDSQTLGLSLWDGTDQGRLMTPVVGSSANVYTPLHLVRRFTPTAASHTYKVRGWALVGSCYVRATASNAGFIRVLQRGSA